MLLLLISQKFLEKQWFRQSDTEERNERARKAYEMVLTLTLSKPLSAKYMDFSKRVKERTIQDFGKNIYGHDEEVRSY